MFRLVVSDTSPIRALAHLGELRLLELLFGEVLVPPAVFAELTEPRSSLSALPPSCLTMLRVQAPLDSGLVRRFRMMLDAGESEALALAKEVHADALLIDERKGRTIAASEGVVVTGLIGVLIGGKNAGHVKAIAPLLDRLEHELKFFISPAFRAEALRLAGE